MSIASEISRLQTAKTDIKTAIEAKGVTVPSSATIDTYDDYVAEISGGGSSADTEALINLIERDITSIDIPSGTTSIGNYAFNSCSSLSNVTIPRSVTTIGSYAFQRCTSLSSITLPDSVTSIGDSAFSSCSSLTGITIPDRVTRIGDSAFNSCSGLSGITIPNSVTSIGFFAFANCTSLTGITIPDSVTSIEGYVLAGCYSLTSITVEAVTPPALESGAFNGTNDCPIYVPSESVETYKAESGWSSYASRIQAIP